MKYDHCPICGSTDFEKVSENSSCHSTIYQCEDCGYKFEIEDDMYGYDDSTGWH